MDSLNPGATADCERQWSANFATLPRFFVPRPTDATWTNEIRTPCFTTSKESDTSSSREALTLNYGTKCVKQSGGRWTFVWSKAGKCKLRRRHGARLKSSNSDWTAPIRTKLRGGSAFFAWKTVLLQITVCFSGSPLPLVSRICRKYAFVLASAWALLCSGRIN